MPVIRPIVDDAPKKSFSQSVFLLMSSTVITQAITVVASPFLSRIFDASAFGLAGLVSTVAGSMAWAGGFRYESAIVLAKRQKTANVLATTVIQISFVVALLALVLAVFYYPSINRLLGTNVLGGWLCLAPLYFFFTAYALAQRMVAIRNQDFLVVTRSQFVSTIGTVVLQFATGLLLSSSGFSIIFSTISGIVVGSIVLWVGNKGRFVRLQQSKKRRRQLVLATLYKYRFFPIYKLPYSIIGTVSPSFLVFALSSNYGLKTAGFFFLSRRISSIPVTIIVGALSQVFFAKAASELGTTALSLTIHRIHRLIILFLISPALLSIGILPDLFEFSFGTPWREAGKMTSWYLFYSFAVLLTAWIDRLYDVTGKQKIALYLQIASEIFSLSVIGVGLIWNSSAISIVAAYSITTLLYNLLWIYITFHLNFVSLQGFWQNLRLLGCTLLVCLGFNFLLLSSSLTTWWVVAVDGTICALLLFLNKASLIDFVGILRRR